MKKEYDFSNAIKNPYSKYLKNQATICVNNDIINYFKQQSESCGIPYETLINLYLEDCVKEKKQPQVIWRESQAV